jgi:hypothetical protein
MIRRLKNRTLSKGLLIAFNARFGEWSRITRLELDTQSRSIDLEISLAGESEPLTARIALYEITEEEGRCFLAAEKIVTSREWINRLFEEHLKDRRVEIPQRYGTILKRFM